MTSFAANQAANESFADPSKQDPTRESTALAKGREKMWPYILGGYLALLTLAIIVPIVVVPLLGSASEIQQIKELMDSMSGLTQGLFGILGVVVGYYYRDAQENGEAANS